MKDLGREQEFLKKYERFIVKDDEIKDPNFLKAIELANKGKYHKAITFYNKALELNPNDADIWHLTGCAFSELDSLEQAMQCFEKALNLRPDFAVAMSMKASILSMWGRSNEALELYDKSLKIDPDQDYVWNFKGLIANERKEYEQAIKYFDKALDITPGNSNALFGKKLAYENLLESKKTGPGGVLKFCPNCGSQLNAGAKFCGSCGSRL